MYEEIDQAYEALEYICADKQKKSSSSLRARADEEDGSAAKDPARLKAAAKTVHEWVGSKKSYVPKLRAACSS